MLLQGNTTPTPWLCPHRHRYCYYCYYCTTTSDFITPPSLQSNPPPHLFSWARWTVSCCQARTERREAARREDFQNKSSSDTGDMTLQKSAAPQSSFPFPFSTLIYGVPVDVLCMYFLCFGSGTLLFLGLLTVVDMEAEGRLYVVVFFCFVYKTTNLFLSTVEIRECLFKVLILHHDEFRVELMRICQCGWT